MVLQCVARWHVREFFALPDNGLSGVASVIGVEEEVAGSALATNAVKTDDLGGDGSRAPLQLPDLCLEGQWLDDGPEALDELLLRELHEVREGRQAVLEEDWRKLLEALFLEPFFE